MEDEPLFGSEIMARMAVAAELGGAVGIRANSPVDISAIRTATSLPIIGLWKVNVASFDVYITPRLSEAIAVSQAGADIIAIDATNRPHPDGETSEYIGKIRDTAGKPVLADVSTYAEAIAAQEAGADFISTTMSGYTRYSAQGPGPDIALIRALSSVLKVPLIAEGRISSPEEARAAMDAGAFAVVVGGAITRPQQITKRFFKALKD
jgi:N-acylglucosamine-6-phosphate 2-epimerase